jgi:ComF family protein
VLVELAVRLINLVAPRQCAMCGCRLGIGEDVICTACNIGLPRTGYAAKPYDNEMAKLFWGRIPVEKAAALFFYRAHSDASKIIYKLKYLNHPETGELMGRMAAMEFAAKHFFDGIDAIVPIPLSKKRKRERGYNQSLEIARGVSQITRLPIISNAVKRKSFKGSQTQMNRWQRNENVEDEFVLKDSEAVKGRHILIIDDVVTTGATIISCATELAKASGVKFSVMSLGLTK